MANRIDRGEMKGGLRMHRQLTIRDRVILQYSIENDSSASSASLAAKLKCHPSTVFRELKRNRISTLSKKERFMKQPSTVCLKLDRFPFVCNPCPHRLKCSKTIRIYDAYEADRIANHSLRQLRSHPYLATQDLKRLNEKISPRVQSHQSLYHILSSDPSIPVCESTLRRYIDKGYLDCRNLDLPRTVRFPYTPPSKRPPRKRINVSILVNRTYQDYIDYSATQSRVTLQLDTVIGKTTDTKCLLTLYEPLSKFQWGYMVHRSATDVNAKLSRLIDTLIQANHLFFDCLLTDNGSEFQHLPLLETSSSGEIRLRVFFCDPYASYQKGGCERNHSLIRYLIKKGESLDFVTQSEIDLVFSHINAQRRKSLAGKSPLQGFEARFHFHPSVFVDLVRVDDFQIKLK